MTKGTGICVRRRKNLKPLYKAKKPCYNSIQVGLRFGEGSLLCAKGFILVCPSKISTVLLIQSCGAYILSRKCDQNNMTYAEYCVLDYVVYGKHNAVKHFTEKEMCGWIDYYHRYVLNQKEIDTVICALIAQGFLVQMKNTYQASADVKALWKASRYWIGDILGLRDCTRSRFKENLIKKYGILTDW